LGLRDECVQGGRGDERIFEKRRIGRIGLH
jgi:hypothetical protein